MGRSRRACGAAAALAVLLVSSGHDAAAQQGRRGQNRPAPPEAGDPNSPFSIRAARERQEQAGLIETGIRVFFAENVNCPGVASPFGAQTRHDGSSRVGEANNGFHAGLDISSPEGTPLLAIADGVVTEKREGGLLAGIQIYFQHSPADTGFPVWLYSKYQHLREPSPLAVGERVRVGQVIGYSGRTGTVGGHYGARGYPHLYLSLYVGADEAFVVGPGGALPVQGRFLDPLAIYTTGPLDNHQLKDLPGPRKLVVAPYKLADGRTVPSDTRVVWPYLCSPW